MKQFGGDGRRCQMVILALKKPSLLPGSPRMELFSPMISSSRYYRILHSFAAFQECSAKFTHSPLFVLLSCRCTALGLAPQFRV